MDVLELISWHEYNEMITSQQSYCYYILFYLDLFLIAIVCYVCGVKQE